MSYLLKSRYSNSSYLALMGWMVAGIPLIPVFIQAMAVIFGKEVNQLPVVGGVAELAFGIEVIQTASFKLLEQRLLVSALFVVIIILWLVLGLTVIGDQFFDERTDRVRIWSVGGIWFLYMTLFLGVYFDVLFGPDPLFQRILFFLLPMLTVSAGLVAILIMDTVGGRRRSRPRTRP